MHARLFLSTICWMWSILPFEEVGAFSECPTVIKLDKLGDTKSITSTLSSNAVKRWNVLGNGYPIRITIKQLNMGKFKPHEVYENFCDINAPPLLKVVDNKYPFFPLVTICGNKLVTISSYGDFLNVTHMGGAKTTSSFTMEFTSVECGQDHYFCPSGQATNKCIPQSKLCDGVKDCAEGEDEICTDKCGVGGPLNVKQPFKPRIVGGTEALPNSWPWQAFVVAKGRYRCGGSIIGPKWIMTAAHCCMIGEKDRSIGPQTVHSAGDVQVFVGEHIKQESSPLKVKRVIPHIFYSWYYNAEMEELRNDFCMLKLEEPIQFTAKVGPICLAQMPEPPPGTSCYATGWGRTVQTSDTSRDYTSKRLMEVDLTLVTEQYCAAIQYFEGKGLRGGQALAPEMICARSSGKGSCLGDSGGPLACRIPKADQFRWQLVGVTSQGDMCGTSPSWFARVRSALGMVADVLYVEKYDGWFTNRTIKRYDPTVKYEKEDFLVSVPNTKPDAVYDMSKYPSNTSWGGQPNFKETCNKDLIFTSTTPVTKVVTKVVTTPPTPVTKVTTKVATTPSTRVTKVPSKVVTTSSTPVTKVSTKVVTTPSTPVTKVVTTPSTPVTKVPTKVVTTPSTPVTKVPSKVVTTPSTPITKVPSKVATTPSTPVRVVTTPSTSVPFRKKALLG